MGRRSSLWADTLDRGALTGVLVMVTSNKFKSVSFLLAEKVTYLRKDLPQSHAQPCPGMGQNYSSSVALEHHPTNDPFSFTISAWV